MLQLPFKRGSHSDFVVSSLGNEWKRIHFNKPSKYFNWPFKANTVRSFTLGKKAVDKRRLTCPRLLVPIKGCYRHVIFLGLSGRQALNLAQILIVPSKVNCQRYAGLVRVSCTDVVLILAILVMLVTSGKGIAKASAKKPTCVRWCLEQKVRWIGFVRIKVRHCQA